MPGHKSGKFHAWVLDTDDTWVDVYGREHVIQNMDTDYLENVLAFLLDGALHYWRCHMQQEEGIKVAELDPIGLAFFLRMDRATARHWMLRTPLVVGILRTLVKRHDPDD